MGKLINRIPGSRILISSLPGSALRTHVESLGKPRDVCQHAFSKPCLVNLISKDTHLVFSIYMKTDDLKVLYSTIPNRLQAVIRTNCGVTTCEMTCQIFTRNEISSKINVIENTR